MLEPVLPPNAQVARSPHSSAGIRGRQPIQDPERRFDSRAHSAPRPAVRSSPPIHVWETGVHSPEVSFPALLGTFALTLTDAYGKDSLTGREGEGKSE